MEILKRIQRVKEKGNQIVGFFFFKQKTADEMLGSLVGSEMCVRDSLLTP